MGIHTFLHLNIELLDSLPEELRDNGLLKYNKLDFTGHLYDCQIDDYLRGYAEDANQFLLKIAPYVHNLLNDPHDPGFDPNEPIDLEQVKQYGFSGYYIPGGNDGDIVHLVYFGYRKVWVYRVDWDEIKLVEAVEETAPNAISE